MRYILGVNIYYKETDTTYDGLAIIGSWGLYPSVLSVSKIKEEIENNKEVTTIIYNDLESIQKVISEYSVKFRRDDVWQKSQKWQKSKKIIRFYPIKVDSNKFQFKIVESSRKSKNGEKLYKLC